MEALNNPNIERELRDDFLDNVLGELRNEETGNNVIESEVVEVKTTNPEFQAEVLVALDQLIQENGYGKRFQIKQQIKVDNYLINIGIYDKKEQKFVLGIEIDGEHYNKTLAQKEYDFYRQKYLEVRNWKIYRIPLLKWEVNREKVLRDIALKMEGVK